MSKFYSVNGYWKEDKEPFQGYIVSESEEVSEDIDDLIFFYGVSEEDLKAAIVMGEDTAEDFVITSYYEQKN